MPRTKKAKKDRFAAVDMSDVDKERDYVLNWPESGVVYGKGDGPVDMFQRRLVALLAERQTMLRLWKHKCPSWACPLATRPLACTEMAYCQHGLGRDTTRASVVACAVDDCVSAPEAPMDACLSPMPWPESAERAAVDWTAHVDERTVDICGLRFAVDTCHGGLRVVMA